MKFRTALGLIAVFSFALIACGPPSVEDLKARAEAGDVDAKYQLAQLLNREGSADQAFKWFLKAAENGHKRSASIIGRRYLDNEDTDEAIKWFKIAEDQFYLDMLVNVLRLEHFAHRVELNERGDGRHNLSWKATVSNNTSEIQSFQIWIYGYDSDGFEVYENIMTPILLELAPSDKREFATRSLIIDREYQQVDHFVCQLRRLSR